MLLFGFFYGLSQSLEPQHRRNTMRRHQVETERGGREEGRVSVFVPKASTGYINWTIQVKSRHMLKDSFIKTFLDEAGSLIERERG